MSPRLISSVAFVWLLFPPITAQSEVVVEPIKSFGDPERSGSYCNWPPIVSASGELFGITEAGGKFDKGTVFSFAPTTGNYRVIYAFKGPQDGASPSGKLIQGSDGMLYGVTRRGGLDDAGTVFKIDIDGRQLQVLWQFGFEPSSGAHPVGGVIQGTDGMLYGTASSGGLFDDGTIFSLSTNGMDLYTVRTFGQSGTVGRSPRTPLIEGSDGSLYGVTPFDGSSSWRDIGVLYRVSKSGSEYQVLYRFSFDFGRGWEPNGIIEGSDGALYGTTKYGPAANSSHGTVYRINKDGSDHTILYGFETESGGHWPYANVVEGADGALYGTAAFRGDPNGSGVVFRMNKDGSDYQTLHKFLFSDEQGYSPESALTVGQNGELYGVARWGGYSGYGVLYRVQDDGASYSVLHHFSPSGGDSSFPIAGLLQASDGGFLGLSSAGGMRNKGTFFKMRPDGTGYAILYHFGAPGTGESPAGKLVRGSDGVLYGTTSFGGSNYSGTIFKINEDGSGYSDLHHFSFRGSDGAALLTGLLEGSDGRLYGTTPDSTTNYCGTIFGINKNGSGFVELVVQTDNRFSGAPSPVSAPLIECTDGLLYGTAYQGGQSGFGTVFRVARNGSGYEVLHHFGGTNANDGAYPAATLLHASDGSLYGTTERGGSQNIGTVFRLERDGTAFLVLHQFTDADPGAGRPAADLIESSDGWLYGLTRIDPFYNTNQSVIFRLKKNGTDFTVLHGSSRARWTGQKPVAGLFTASDGSFYGVSPFGDGNAHGMIFRMRFAFEIGISLGSPGLQLQFGGFPGTSYELQRTSDLTGPWETIALRQAALDNVIRYTDQNAPPSAAFYRVRRAP